MSVQTTVVLIFMRQESLEKSAMDHISFLNVFSVYFAWLTNLSVLSLQLYSIMINGALNHFKIWASSRSI